MNPVSRTRSAWHIAIGMILWLSSTTVLAQEENDAGQALAASTELDAKDEDRDSDDTPDVETDNTIDAKEERRGLKSTGDLRPIIDYQDVENRDGISSSDGELGFRVRLGADWAVRENFRLGARIAGTCFTDDCDVDFVLNSGNSRSLPAGEFTFDEIYLHWFKTKRFDLAVGRLQTRFVLRSGVYAKSLDRNDSNNTNVTWTDGLHGTYHGPKGWESHFILQRNSDEGSGSIRRAPLDFADRGARNTYFLATENLRPWGLVVQRAFDISYLPDSLLKDGDPNGPREDYWGLVGRLAVRWPQRGEGIRFRGGAEVGYAPTTPTAEAVSLSGDVSGLAWDLVASLMDFAPGHNIGLNYGRTGAGWLLSPQFRPNEELIEIRYQWRGNILPLVEARWRWREDLEQEIDAMQKRRTFDFYLRVTWFFTIKDR